MPTADLSGPSFVDPVDDAALIAWFDGMATRHPGAPAEIFDYGSQPEQVVEVWPALGSRVGTAARGAVVSIHGGAFMAEFDRVGHHPVSSRLQSEGYDVYNLEYRRTGSTRSPVDSVKDAMQAVQAVHQRDDRPLAVVGHSVGGFLAEWVAEEPGVDLVLSLSPITDLARWGRDADPDGCLDAWLGTAATQATELCSGLNPDPGRRTTARRLLLHGSEDQVVPIEHSRAYVRRAPVDNPALIELTGHGHYAFMDPDSAPFDYVLIQLAEWTRGL